MAEQIATQEKNLYTDPKLADERFVELAKKFEAVLISEMENLALVGKSYAMNKRSADALKIARSLDGIGSFYYQMAEICAHTIPEKERYLRHGYEAFSYAGQIRKLIQNSSATSSSSAQGLLLPSDI